MLRYLNLGCGHRFHSDWVNVDFTATGPAVIACDLRQGIPFPADSFDVVYHSHLLEHLPPTTVPPFLTECHRVLKPGGIIRVVVPDLEQIARLYLLNLEAALTDGRAASLRRQWMVLELCDQMTRTSPGGELAKRISHLEPELSDFVSSRLGVEMRWWQRPTASPCPPSSPIPQSSSRFRTFLTAIRSPSRWKELILRQLLSASDYSALQIGRFRQRGEVHQWMYDRVALSELLVSAGFVGIAQQSHISSYVREWSTWLLDASESGSAAKPDSLFMEARRP